MKCNSCKGGVVPRFNPCAVGGMNVRPTYPTPDAATTVLQAMTPKAKLAKSEGENKAELVDGGPPWPVGTGSASRS